MEKLWVSIFFVFIPIVLFAQDKSKSQPMIPQSQLAMQAIATSQKQDSLEAKIKRQVDDIKSSLWLDFLLRYVAIREENPYLCKSLGCQQAVRDEFLTDRYVCEGRCEKVKQNTAKEFCEALRSNSPERLSAWKKKFWDAFQNVDIDTMVKITNSQEFFSENGSRLNLARNLQMLRMYWGFKTYSVVACERFLEKGAPLARQFSCRLLFSEDADKELDEILRGFAIVLLSKKENRADLCNLIENKKIKEACLNPLIKTPDDIFGDRNNIRDY